MKWLLYTLISMFLNFQGIYSQVSEIQGQDVPLDTTDGKTHIRGELSLTETIGGRISGSSFSGDEAFTATSCAVDFYLYDGFSFGPEAGIFVNGFIRPLFGLNMAYTHWQASGTRGAFIRLGYGVVPPVEDHTAIDIWGLFSAGLGMKFMLSAKSLFRLEITYKQQWWKENPQVYLIYTPPPSGSEIIFTEHEEYKTKGSIGILIGFSAILR